MSAPAQRLAALQLRPAAVVGLPAGGTLLSCGHAHSGPGTLDETARRLSHPELAVALRLAGEGHRVRSLGEGRTGPIADLMVCGSPVEVKTLRALDDRTDGRPAGWRTVHNRLASAVRQAAIVVLDAGGSGLSAADAEAGVRYFAGKGAVGKVREVRVLGDGFAQAWRLVPGREMAAGRVRSPDPLGVSR